MPVDTMQAELDKLSKDVHQLQEVVVRLANQLHEIISLLDKHEPTD